MITIKTGNIFSTKSEYIVNTVNCFGIMGAGLALEFKLRYPDMFNKYVELSENKQIEIGKLWIYKTADRNILSFPTKNHWKPPSKIEYIEKGLEKFVATYIQRKVSSIAFPLLGVGNGELSKDTILTLMEKYLGQIDINIEIWQFQESQDYEFEEFRNFILELPKTYKSKIPKKTIFLFQKSLENRENINLSSLTKVKGISEKRTQEIFQIFKYYKFEPNLFE